MVTPYPGDPTAGGRCVQALTRGRERVGSRTKRSSLLACRVSRQPEREDHAHDSEQSARNRLRDIEEQESEDEEYEARAKADPNPPQRPPDAGNRHAEQDPSREEEDEPYRGSCEKRRAVHVLVQLPHARRPTEEGPADRRLCKGGNPEESGKEDVADDHERGTEDRGRYRGAAYEEASAATTPSSPSAAPAMLAPR
jgi:hypothetical protein